MPLKNICVYAAVVQMVSFVTFLSFLGTPDYRESFAKTDINHRVSPILLNLPGSTNHRNCSKSLQRNDLAKLCNEEPNMFGLCSSLIIGDPKQFQPLLMQKRATYLEKPTQCRLSELSKNCENLRAAHEYFDKPITETEREFPLAFAIKMHKDAEQAEKLLRTVYRQHNVYCIYVDGKSHPIIYETILNVSRCIPNVHVIQDRVNITYASFAHVRSELQCMKKCTESHVRWKYYINLTGQEFPLKTNKEIVMILKALNGANDIESYNHPVFMRWRYEKKFKYNDVSIVETSVAKDPFKYNLQISKGSAYGSFTRDFVDFVLNDDIAQTFISWLHDTYAPEENVWATLNTLPWAPGGYEIETRHRFDTFVSRAMIWEDEHIGCQGRFLRSVCVYGAEDLMWLTSKPQLFANKFDHKMDPVTLDCLEGLIRNRTMHESMTSLDWYYYRNLPHARLYAKPGHRSDRATLLLRKKQWLQKHSTDSIENNLLKSRIEKSNELRVPGGSISMYKVYV